MVPERGAVGRPQWPETPPRGGEAGPEPARSLAPSPRGGEGKSEGRSEWERESWEKEAAVRREEEAGKAARPAPASARPAAGGVRRGCRVRSPRRRAAAASPPGPPSRPRGCWPGGTWCPSAVPRLRLCASPMAEGRRREDEEEELRDRRELGGPRRARGRALSGHPAAGEGRGEREEVRGAAGWAPRGRAGPAPEGGGSHPPRWHRHLLEARGRVGFPSSSSLSCQARGHSHLQR